MFFLHQNTQFWIILFKSWILFHLDEPYITKTASYAYVF